MSAADPGEAPLGRPPTSNEAASLAAGRRSLGRRLRWPLMIGTLALALAVGLLVYMAGGRIEATDDAYVKTARVTVSSNIAGRVIEIAVRDNQAVKAGQLLFKLDSHPAQTAYEEAQANLAAARLQVAGLKATYRQRQADVKAAQAALAYQQGELARQRELLATGVTSGAQVAQTANAAQQAEQALAASRQEMANALAALGGDPNLDPAAHPAVMQARAQLDRAGLNQSYVVIAAPQDGVVTKVDQLQVGDYVGAAQPVFSLIANRAWIEANFKENQLAHMRPGQEATVKLDAFPEARLRARVDSLSPGTGSSFSLLPAENATGNWVKVVQRVPVRLTFVGRVDAPLQAGLSATVKVDTLHKRSLPFFGGPLAVSEAAHPEGDGVNRAMITGSIMLATIMNTLDTTIANVALPHMQGSVSASASQITWVLTSYIVAAAIMTPITGWLAGRFGRKQVFLVSVAGFTLASALCGMAQDLSQLVLFRLLQGVFGAALIPLSQAVLLDINPIHRHGQAMAMWGMGVLIGPIVGPALGGWLTDNYSWRWVFYINIPTGVLAFMGILTFIHNEPQQKKIPFDFLGFGLLSLAIAAGQMMVDRGDTQDWFKSAEVCIEAAVAGVALLLFVIHSCTASRPFFSAQIFTDRNMLTGMLFGLLTSVMLFASGALLPLMMETLLGYPVLTTGLISAPRGIASVVSMMVVGQLISRVDPRALVAVGLALSSLSLYMMSQFTLQMDFSLLIWSGLIQGAGMSMLFVPISTMAFATLPGHLRTEGSSVYNLVRNMGGSAGISLTQVLLSRNANAVHSRLVENLRPDNPMAQAPYLHAPFSLTDPAGMAVLNAEVTRQAMMVSYADIFWLMTFMALAFVPALALLRKPAHMKSNDPALAAH